MAALALGVSHWQAVTQICSYYCKFKFWRSLDIFGRAVGETMVVLVATGNSLIDTNILNSIRTLTANIEIEIPESNVASSKWYYFYLRFCHYLSPLF